jgi:hypothetical protein
MLFEICRGNGAKSCSDKGAGHTNQHCQPSVATPLASFSLATLEFLSCRKEEVRCIGIEEAGLTSVFSNYFRQAVLRTRVKVRGIPYILDACDIPVFPDSVRRWDPISKAVAFILQHTELVPTARPSVVDFLKEMAAKAARMRLSALRHGRMVSIGARQIKRPVPVSTRENAPASAEASGKGEGQ